MLNLAGESVGAGALGVAEDVGGEGADGGIGHRRVLVSDGVFHQIADAVIVGVGIGTLLIGWHHAVGEGAGDPRGEATANDQRAGSGALVVCIGDGGHHRVAARGRRCGGGAVVSDRSG